MGYVAGTSGSFKVGANKVANLDSWKLDIETDLKGVTNFGSGGWEENYPTIKKYSGSVSGTWDVSADTNGQKALQDAMLGGTTVAAVFDVDGTHNYSGTVFVKKISIEEKVDDIAKFTAEVTGTGALVPA